jgi:hypothetical protein
MKLLVRKLKEINQSEDKALIAQHAGSLIESHFSQFKKH